MSDLVEFLKQPPHLWEREEVLGPDCPIPAEPGLYAWYFRGMPSTVPTDGCLAVGDHTLLYVGISPKAPPASGGPGSKQTLRSRVRFHFRGDAGGSTLRLTLGCLLAKRLGIELRRVGSGKRLIFGPGEQALSEWMGENARVAVLPVAEAWAIESELIGSVALPLNLDQSQHPFRPTLKGLRREARVRAKELPILE